MSYLRCSIKAIFEYLAISGRYGGERGWVAIFCLG